MAFTQEVVTSTKVGSIPLVLLTYVELAECLNAIVFDRVIRVNMHIFPCALAPDNIEGPVDDVIRSGQI